MMDKLPPDIKQAVIDILSEQEYVLHHSYVDYNFGKHSFCLTGAIGAACGLNPELRGFNSKTISDALAEKANTTIEDAFNFLFENGLPEINDNTDSMEDLIEYVQANL